MLDVGDLAWMPMTCFCHYGGSPGKSENVTHRLPCYQMEVKHKGAPEVVQAHRGCRSGAGFSARGPDIPRGTVDVIVCEGLAMLLKMLKGTWSSFRTGVRS